MYEKVKIFACFLLLHYKEKIEIIEEAIDLILQLHTSKEVMLVIVDNASVDDCIEVLKERYTDASAIQFIQLPENKGYSHGNNAGYFYIKEKFEPEFLIVMNPDVMIRQSDFLTRLSNLYEEEPFYVAGPDIYEPLYDTHSSPLNIQVTSEAAIHSYEMYLEEMRRKFEKKDIKCLKSYISRCKKSNKLIYYTRRCVRKIRRRDVCGWNMRNEGVQLQGACLIFDKRFITINEKLFSPETFLYSEEHILWRKCQKNGWRQMYFPELEVEHLREESTGLSNLSFQEYCKKKSAQYKQLRAGLMIYRDYWLKTRSGEQ